MSAAITAAGTGVLVRIRVQVRASRSEVVGLHGDSVRVRLTAPPVEGAANDALLELLGRLVGVPRSCLVLKSGLTSRSKTVLIPELGVEVVRRRLGVG